MNEFGCRCRGFNYQRDGVMPCGDAQQGSGRIATQEDGLCDDCRCPHGCCEDHTNWSEHQDCFNSKIPDIDLEIRVVEDSVLEQIRREDERTR